MKLGNYEFSPKPWATLLFVALFLCMLSLANWQLDRAALKVSMQASTEKAMNAVAEPISAVEDLRAAATRYQRVQVQGAYDPDRQFLWDNRTHKGQAGYEVISVLALDDGRNVLVNRGWLPPGASRQELPDISIESSVLSNAVTLEGFLSTPSKGFASGNAVTGGDGWPKLLQYFDYDAVSEVLGEAILPVVVQAQALSIDATSPLVLTSRPEWLAANWQPAASGPAKHYSYAFQWFAMAVALTGIFGIVNTRKLVENHV